MLINVMLMKKSVNLYLFLDRIVCKLAPFGQLAYDFLTPNTTEAKFEKRIPPGGTILVMIFDSKGKFPRIFKTTNALELL